MTSRITNTRAATARRARSFVNRSNGSWGRRRHRKLRTRMSKRLSRPLVAAADAAGIMGIRAGAKSEHRFVGVWPIVVDGRLFARSWTQSRGGWYKTFLDDRLGVIQVGDRQLRVRAIPVKSER